jgi:serine/threonine protein kinase
MDQLKPETIIDDKYRVIDTLGVGGMGIVYRVEQLSLNSERALKTIHTAKLSEGVWHRFQREAKAACRLDHSNLVKVFDYGLLEKVTPYYVMEIVQGQTLSARIKILGPLTIDQCLSVFIPTAFALAYAHEKKIIHRDMKPANIMLSESNGKITDVKVLDFGIAKLVSDGNLTNALTKPGEVIGSPHFMSPEQSWGGNIDARSDIYSLGCSMFEALTGLPPFIAKNAVQVIMLHQTATPPTLAQTAPNLTFSDSIEQVLRVMLAKEPDHRYQSMDELAQDLIAIKSGKQPKFAQLQERLSGTQPPEDNRTTSVGKSQGKSIDRSMDRTIDRSIGRTLDNSLDDSLSDLTPLNSDEEELTGSTFDQISESQTLTTSMWKKVNVPAVALTILLIGAACTVLSIVRPTANSYRSSTSTGKATSDANSSEASNSTSNAKSSSLPKVTLSPATIATINAPSVTALPNTNEPFAHERRLENGQEVLVFNFPTAFTLGAIHSLDGRHSMDARGEVTIPRGGQFFFRPSREFLEKPHLFKRFGTNQIAELDVGDRHMFNNEHMADLKHMSSIGKLNLKDVNLTPKCINDLNGLTRLTELIATNSGLDDKSMSNLKRLRDLEFLEVREFVSSNKTIKALAGSTKMQKLALGNTCLDNNALKSVAKNTNITYLSVPQNPKITDEGLKNLLPLTKLEHLNLLDCQISPKSIATLARFKKLHTIKLTTDGWSKADVAALKQLLPRKCNVEQDETSPRKSQAVLDQLREFRSIGPPDEK